VPSISFHSVGPAIYGYLGGLTDGYYVTGVTTSRMDLYSSDNIGVSVDSVSSLHLRRTWSAATPSGVLYVIGASPVGDSTLYLQRVTQTDGQLSVDVVGSVSMNYLASQGLSVSPDGSEVALNWYSNPSYGVKVLSTTDASVVADITVGGSALQRSFAAGNGRVVQYASPGTWNLRSTSGIVDSVSAPVDLSSVYPPQVKPLASGDLVAGAHVDIWPEPPYYSLYAVRLSVVGDSLEKVWSTTISTPWLSDDVGWDTIFATRGDWAAIVPRSPFYYSTGKAGIYLLDCSTGRAFYSGDTTDFATYSWNAGSWDRGVYFLDTNRVAWWESNAEKIRVWDADYSYPAPVPSTAPSPPCQQTLVYGPTEVWP
jgi:hypothetical protein